MPDLNQDSAEQEPDDLLGGDSTDEGASDEPGQSMFGDLESDADANAGLNVDLSSMTDEEVLAFAQENPGAIRGRVGMQAANTQRSQELSQREQSLNEREGNLSKQSANLQELLTGAGGQSPQGGNGQTPARTIADAADINEALQIQQDNILGQVDARLQAANEAAAKERQTESQHAAFTRQIDDGFAELSRDYPATDKPEVRTRIEKVMADKGIADPTAAYLYMNRAGIRERHVSDTEKRTSKRKAAPGATRPTKSRTTGATKPKTPEDRKAAALNYALQHPEDFPANMFSDSSEG